MVEAGEPVTLGDLLRVADRYDVIRAIGQTVREICPYCGQMNKVLEWDFGDLYFVCEYCGMTIAMVGRFLWQNL